MADSTIQQDLYESLTFIKQYFMDEITATSPIFGTGLNAQFTETSASDEMTTLMKNLYGGFTKFNDAYANEIKTKDELAISGNVLTRNVQLKTNAYVAGSGAALASTNDYYFTEVNLTKFLKEGTLLSRLNDMRIVYSLLDPLVYNVYRSMITDRGTPSTTRYFKVQKYATDGLNQTEYVIDSDAKFDDVKTCMNRVLRVPIENALVKDSDIVAIRRVLRLHELMANINIALRLYGESKASQDSLNVFTLCSNAILYANKNMTRDVKSNMSESVPDIAIKLKERANIYKQDSQAIDILDQTTSDQRMTMKTENEKLENRRMREKTSISILYGTLAVTIVVGLVSMGAWFAPMDKKQKLSIMAIAFAVGLIIATILHIVYNKQVENFDVSAAENPVVTSAATIDAVLLANIQVMQNAMMGVASEYVTNTVQLAMMLSTYRTYGVVNHMMLKERAYYTDRAVQMDNTNTKLATASDALQLQQTIQKARISFFISLMVVICLTVIGLASTDTLPQAKNIILGVAAVLILIMTFAYFMDTSGRVNTSGQKFYWSKPDTNTLL